MPLGSRCDFGHDRLGNVDKKSCSADFDGWSFSSVYEPSFGSWSIAYIISHR